MADQTFDNVKLKVSFTEATERENIVSGENISTSFGKISKVISDLEAGEFGDSATINEVEVTGDLDSVNDLKVAGKVVTGTSYYVDGKSVVAAEGAEIFNDYYNNSATGTKSHAEGFRTQASGEYSHAEGTENYASGDYSHAEGNGTKSSGESSHSEGVHATSSGIGSHAEGYYTTSSGNYSHAEGNSIASAQYAHSEGAQTTASGYASHAGGLGTKATKRAQTVIGRYNEIDTDTTTDYGKYGFILGNGTASDARSNAFAVTWDGEIESATGKGLSEANFTNEEKTKLASITNPMVIKGTVATKDTLPTTASVGWIYFVGTDGSSEYDEYVYTENNTWELIGHTTIDMSGYVQTTDIATTTNVGLVKPDGVTLTTNADGVLSAVTGTDDEIDAMFADTDWEY